MDEEAGDAPEGEETEAEAAGDVPAEDEETLLTAEAMPAFRKRTSSVFSPASPSEVKLLAL